MADMDDSGDEDVRDAGGDVPADAAEEVDGDRRDEDLRAAVAIIRLIDELEVTAAGRARRIEPHVVRVLARRAGYMGCGARVLEVVRGAVRAGEGQRRAEAAASAQRPIALNADTECAGHG